jgi:hypothetical protein
VTRHCCPNREIAGAASPPPPGDPRGALPWSISQYVGLTPAQTWVLRRLEEVFPDARSAAAVAPEVDLDVRSALAALRGLEALGRVARGPRPPNEPDEATSYRATTQRR